jgi:hypothetical protein
MAAAKPTMMSKGVPTTAQPREITLVRCPKCGAKHDQAIKCLCPKLDVKTPTYKK